MALLDREKERLRPAVASYIYYSSERTETKGRKISI